MPKSRVRNIVFPAGGIDRSVSFQNQRPFTTPDAQNVWPKSQEDSRERGGSRPGLVRSVENQVNGDNPVNMLADLAYVDTTDIRRRVLIAGSGGSIKLNNSGPWTELSGTIRIAQGYHIQAVGHASGVLYIADYSKFPLAGQDGTVVGQLLTSPTYPNWLLSGNEVPNPIDYVVVIRSVFGDTNHSFVGIKTIESISGGTITIPPSQSAGTTLSPVTFSVERAVKAVNARAGPPVSIQTGNATTGYFPQGNPIIAAWRDRLVFAGGHEAPNNWYMSKVSDPTNWLFATLTADQAVAGDTSDAGQVGEPITALIPFSDTSLIIGCENQIWVMRGDPAAGGSLENLSYQVGIARGKAWTWTDTKELYFLGKNGMYSISNPQGEVPTPVSRHRIPEEYLFVADFTGETFMGYDSRFKQILIFTS